MSLDKTEELIKKIIELEHNEHPDDLGNSIGIVLNRIYNDDDDISDFKMGLEHGLDLKNYE